MENKPRVQILILVVAILLICSLGFYLAKDRTAQASSSVGLVGTWLTISEVEGLPPIRVVGTTHSDGTFTAVQPGVAGAGVWEKTSSDSYSQTGWLYVDPGLQGPVSLIKFFSTVQLSQDGESFTASDVIYLYDSEGNFIVSDEGTSTGMRLHVEPAP